MITDRAKLQKDWVRLKIISSAQSTESDNSSFILFIILKIILFFKIWPYIPLFNPLWAYLFSISALGAY